MPDAPGRKWAKSYAWEPLTMTRAEVAATVFRRSEPWLIEHVPADFPHPVDGLYAREAVVEWVRRRHGLAAAPADAQAEERELLGRIGRGKDNRAVSGHKAA